MTKEKITKAVECETLEINRILINAQECFGMFEFLAKDSLDDAETYVKHMYSSLAFLRNTLWERAVLDLSKLLYFKAKDKADTNNRERYNLRHFLRKLAPGGIFEKAAVDHTKISGWLMTLDLYDTQILNLIAQRDKKIAHTDSNHKNVLNTLTFRNVKDLLAIGYDILTEINHVVLNRGISYEPVNSPVENLKIVVADLTIRKKEKETAWKRYRTT